MLSKIKKYLNGIVYIDMMLFLVSLLTIGVGFILVLTNRWDTLDITIAILLLISFISTLFAKIFGKKDLDGVTLEMVDYQFKNRNSRESLDLENSYIDTIKINNYFSIKDIKITNLKDKKEIYFVGENGDGKTILLQAILLALKKKYSGYVIEHIENITDNMTLLVKNENIDEYVSNLNLKNVFAYGINRNKVHYNDFDKYGYGGLFDTSDSRRTTYLKDPFYELGTKYKGKNPVLKEFIQVLNSQILRENYKIFDGGDVNFTELSEGYKSTIIWLYDLVSRLIENQKEIKKLKDFKAIVLIDEVDLYLHPTWKYDFVYNLRKVFPNIQFIMITHSMVTVLGASKDAVFYKVYKENGETKISQPMSDIKNLMANNLSTSPLFDMTTARARNSDENLKTDEDFIYTKIHEIISERVKGKKAIVEDEIVEMINQELDDFLKENDL